LAFVALLALQGCRPAEPPRAPDLTLTPLEITGLAGWHDDRHAEALLAFRRSCTKVAAAAGDRPLAAHPAFGTTGDWQRLCNAAGTVGSGDAAARRFFESRFVPHLAGDNGDPEGLFTGYYEPELKGSPVAHGGYQIPLYQPPPEMVAIDLGAFRAEWQGRDLVGRVQDGRVIPMPSRAEIDAGALAGRRLELLWVEDPVAAFFFHIQGSGRVMLDDGRLVRVGYAGKNGHPYVAVGAELVRRGALAREAVSMQAIRAWLRRHPDQASTVMNLNPSYVFFRIVDGDGPVGSQGVVLTPERSLAVDRAFVPLGTPAWLETADPLDPARPLRRLVVAQDTGGAIKGPVRGDLFWGAGPRAEAAAGTMNARGRYVLLLPRLAATAGR
jgi:membrane-bound lytic murein transglycosylase A